jgi:branched-chain amino acid transport system ATP-binding protein
MSAPLLDIARVSKRFGGLLAIRDVSFTVEEGEIVGLIGPNGAGKTTLFSIAAGQIPPTSGAIHFAGRPVTGLPPHALARLGVGRTFQIVQPFLGLTVLENVVTGALGGKSVRVSSARQRARHVIDQVGLGDRADMLARHLTLPDKKRLELARALATQPRLLLLDEVMAGLTPAEVETMLPILRRIRDGGVTLLIVEHIMRAIMSLSHRIVVIANGEKIAEGPPDAIARDDAVITAYLGRRRAS